MNPMKQGLRLAVRLRRFIPIRAIPLPGGLRWIVRTNGVIAIQVLPDNLMVILRPGRLP